jgi:hypothetical protein
LNSELLERLPTVNTLLNAVALMLKSRGHHRPESPGR